MNAEQAKEAGVLLQAREMKLSLINGVNDTQHSVVRDGGKQAWVNWPPDDVRADSPRRMNLAGTHNGRIRDAILDAARKDIDDIDARLHQLGVDLAPPTLAAPQTGRAQGAVLGAIAPGSVADGIDGIPRARQAGFKAGPLSSDSDGEEQAAAQHRAAEIKREGRKIAGA